MPEPCERGAAGRKDTRALCRLDSDARDHVKVVKFNPTPLGEVLSCLPWGSSADQERTVVGGVRFIFAKRSVLCTLPKYFILFFCEEATELCAAGIVGVGVLVVVTVLL